jgi:DNA-directed RNA polymerase subunit RPC12/RpoP
MWEGDKDYQHAIVCRYCGSYFRVVEELVDDEDDTYVVPRFLIQKTYQVVNGREVNTRIYWLWYVTCTTCGISFPWDGVDEVDEEERNSQKVVRKRVIPMEQLDMFD